MMKVININNWQASILTTINEQDLGTELLPGIRLDQNNFKQLDQNSNLNSLTTFIDGGNGEIIGSANFSLQRIKIASITYKGSKRIARNIQQYTVLITKNKGFKIKILDRNQERNFLEEDCTLHTIAGRFRKQLEFESMLSLLDGRILLRDGELVGNELDSVFLKTFFESAKDTKTTIAGLAKTCTLTTNKGVPCTVALQKITKLPAWIYKTGKDINFVKLHSHSRYVFRLDCNQVNDRLLSVLTQHAKDISFPGYPYGLIEADNFARVTEQECKQEKLILLSKHEKLLEPYLNAINAHDLF